MPPKTKAKRKYKRRYGYPKTRLTTTRWKGNIPLYTTPFPPRYRVKLVYTGYVYNATAGDGANAYTNYTFNLNSLYDPYAGSTGTWNVQPYFFDQISALYKRYNVSGARVEVQWSDPTSVSSMHIIRPTTVGTAPTDFQLLESQPYATKVQNTISGNGARIKRYYDVAKIHGVSKQKARIDDLYSAQVGANPGLQLYLHVFNQNAAGAATNNPCPMNVKITYFATFFDRTVATGS